MSRRLYYSLSRGILKMYYNMVGVDLTDKDFESQDISVRDLEEISPFNFFPNLPESSREVDEEMQRLLDRFCSEFGYSEEDERYKDSYFRAVMGILNTATSLNLMEKDDKDYLLGFERLNAILVEVLRNLNSLPINDTINFYYLILRKEVKNILAFANESPFLALLSYLAMNPNSDLPDFMMFKAKSSEIDFQKFRELIVSNVYSDTDFKTNSTPPKRMSYKTAISLLPQNKE